MKKIYLDPGHGFNTPGKRSPDSSLMEYEFNQDVADKAEKLLLAQGFDVRVTKRMKDKDLGLTERCNLANNWGADIFLSIHANAATNTWSTAKGWEVFSQPGKADSAKLAKLAEQHAFPEVAKFGIKSRGCKTESFAVIRQTHMPAILFEWAFFSNKEECELLKRQDFRMACAIGVAKTACAWFGVAYKDASKPVPAPVPEPVKSVFKVNVNGIEEHYATKDEAYNRGWTLLKNGYKDVFLIEPNGNKYTFAKHPDENPQKPTPVPTPAPKPIPTPTPVNSKGTPIKGASEVTDGGIIDAFIRQSNPHAPAVGQAYIDIGTQLGIRGDIAVCQAIKETGWFKYGGDVTPNQNNFCGLGTTGGGVKGASFPTIRDGVMAHVQHLWAYITNQPLPSGIKVIDPRFKLVQDLNKNAHNFEDLGGRWAVPGFDKKKYASFDAAFKTGETYGQQILQIHATLKAFAAKQKPTPKPIPQPSVPVQKRTEKKDVFYTVTNVEDSKILSVVVDGKGYARVSDIAAMFDKKALWDNEKGEIVISDLPPVNKKFEAPVSKTTVNVDVIYTVAHLGNSQIESVVINGKGFVRVSDMAQSFGYTAKYDSVAQEIAFVR